MSVFWCCPKITNQVKGFGRVCGMFWRHRQPSILLWRMEVAEFQFPSSASSGTDCCLWRDRQSKITTRYRWLPAGGNGAAWAKAGSLLAGSQSWNVWPGSNGAQQSQALVTQLPSPPETPHPAWVTPFTEDSTAQSGDGTGPFICHSELAILGGWQQPIWPFQRAGVILTVSSCRLHPPRPPFGDLSYQPKLACPDMIPQ